MQVGSLYPQGSFNANAFVKVYDKTIGEGNLLTNGNFEGWVGGTSVAPDGWSLSGAGAAVARIESEITPKIGTYCGKITNAISNICELYQTFHTLRGIDYWKGKTVTLGMWVKTATANRVRLWTNNIYSSYHTGDNTWQWLTATTTIASNATYVQVEILIDAGASISAYFDGAVCREAATLAAQTDLNNWEQTSLTIDNTTTINLVDIDGDTAGKFLLKARVVNGYNGGSDLYLRPNNDTGSNYGYQILNGDNTDIGASRAATTRFVIGGNTTLGYISQSKTTISAKSGYVRTAITEYITSITTTTVASINLVGQSWNNTADNITSLVVLASQANGLGIGTSVTLWVPQYSV